MSSIEQPASSGRQKWIVIVLVTLSAAGAVAGFWWNHKSRTQEFLTQCRKATAVEDWQELGKVATEWRRWDPDSADAAIFLADFNQQRGKLEEAVALLSSLSDQNKKTTAALLFAVDISFNELNRPKDALNLIERLKRIAPKLTGVRQRSIFFYALTLQRRKMMNEIRQAISDGAEPPAAYVYLIVSSHLMFSNGPELNAAWSRSAPNDVDYQAAYLAQTADDLFTIDTPTSKQTNRLQQTLSEIESLSAKHPENEALLVSRLFHYADNDNVARVGELLNTVTEEGWTNSMFWRYRGWFHHRNGELAEAEAAYETARNMFRLDWQTWQGLAEVQRMLGKLDAAEASQKIALEGKELRKFLVQLPDVSVVEPDTLHRIATYAEHCGDQLVSQAASKRLQAMNYSSQPSPLRLLQKR